jgi:hypothetical protein
MSRLSGNGRQGVHRGCWETSYDEEMGTKTTHLSLALPPRSPLLCVGFTRISSQAMLLNSHPHLPRFSVVKTEMSEAAFLTRNPVRLTKTIRADGEKVDRYVDEEVRSRETKRVTIVTDA